MHIFIQPSDDAPIYRQIIRQILGSLAAGRLTPGERLPSQRELGQRLVISPLTVKKAYEELEREGVIETRRGQGTFVTERAMARSTDESDLATRLDELKPLIQRLLGSAWAARVPTDALLDAVRNEADRLAAERGDSPDSEPERSTP